MSVGITSGTDDDNARGDQQYSSGSGSRRGKSGRASSGSLRIDIETIRLQFSSMVARLQSRVSLDTVCALCVDERGCDCSFWLCFVVRLCG